MPCKKKSTAFALVKTGGRFEIVPRREALRKSLTCLLTGAKTVLIATRDQLSTRCKVCITRLDTDPGSFQRSDSPEALMAGLEFYIDTPSKQLNVVATEELQYSISDDEYLDTPQLIQLMPQNVISLDFGSQDNQSDNLDDGDVVFEADVHGHKTHSTDEESLQDPFRSPEFSEDEYIPSEIPSSSTASEVEEEQMSTAEVLLAKRKLFNESSYEDSTSKPYLVTADYKLVDSVKCSTLDDAVEVAPAPIPHFTSVKSQSTPDEYEEIRSERNIVSDEPQTIEIRQQIAMIDVHVPRVQVTANKTLHKGIYGGVCFRAAAVYGDDSLKAYVFQRSLDQTHKCVPEFDLQQRKIVAALTRKIDMHYVFETFCCIRADTVLRGEEVSLSTDENVVTYLHIQSDPDKPPQLSPPLRTPTKTKQHCCLYCNKLKTTISRHVLTVHSEEEEVKKALLMSPNSKCRKNLLHKLRLQGDSNYNARVRTTRRIAMRKPITQNVTEHLQCQQCQGLIGKRNFARHVRRCTGSLPSRHRVFRAATPFNPTNADESKLENLLKDLKDDEVGTIARKDQTIRLLGQYFALAHSTKTIKHKLDNCRSHLRRCARLLLQAKILDPTISEFADLMKPGVYKTVMKAIRMVCHMEGDDDIVDSEKSQLALQFGPILSKIASRMKLRLVSKNLPPSDPRFLELENFIILHEHDFKIVKCAEDSFNELTNKGFALRPWKTLSGSLLCQLLIFNRRRVGEISRMRLEDYNKRRQITSAEYNNLTRLEIILAKYYTAMFIMAKGSRIVPVLLNPRQIKYMDLLIEMRGHVGIPGNNVFLFAFPNKEGHLNASVVLAEFANKSNVQHPHRLRGTYLRKQVATMSQLLNLGDNEMQQLADFMGHNLDVHKAHYRTPALVVEITKLARFFSVLGDSDLDTFRGKRLDELEPYLPPENFDCTDVTEEDIAEIFTNADEKSGPLSPQQHIIDDELVGKEAFVPGVRPPQMNYDDLLPTDEQERASTSAKSTQKFVSELKQKTPTKSSERYLKTTPIKTPRKGRPLISDILHVIQSQGSPKRQRGMGSVRWSESEKRFMWQRFGEYVTALKCPPMSLCETVLNENQAKFHESRTGRVLYAWIHNKIVSKRKSR